MREVLETRLVKDTSILYADGEAILMWCSHSELTVLQYLHCRPFTCIVHAVSLIYSGIMHCCYG